MKVHILGICGTFMGGIAMLARERGDTVSGSDQNVYPPMSTQLEEKNIEIYPDYSDAPLLKNPDDIVVGNVMRRGLPIIETLLDKNIPFSSGPEWLARHVLSKRWVLAVSGTHGKTTTSSILTWILEYAGLQPGFLIGGVPKNFGVSARLGKGQHFVVEADEYDSAFFDKRSKFIHYRPKTLIINNIEYDHADIFPNIEAIEQQFHHLVRTVPGSGCIIHTAGDKHIERVLQKGCWTPLEVSGNKEGWHAENIAPHLNAFDVYFKDQHFGRVSWSMTGMHNIANALTAIAAANHAGVDPKVAIQALAEFQGVKRRLEIRGEVNGICVYDDFAHHPTAIMTTIEGVRARLQPEQRLIAVVDIRSNTMRGGHHKDTLGPSLQGADEVYLFKASDIQWDVDNAFKMSKRPGGVFSETEMLVSILLKKGQTGDQVVFMSNGSFNGIHGLFLSQLMVKSRS